VVTRTTVVRSAPKAAKPKRTSQKGGGVQNLIRQFVNPFLGAACVPDGAGGGCISINQTIVLTTGTTGTCAFLVAPDPANLFYIAPDDAAGGWTIPAGGAWAPASNLATIAAVFSKVRCTAIGIRVVFIGATMTDQGAIMYTEQPGSVAPSILGGNGANSFSYQEANALSTAVHPLREEMLFTWRPQDYEDTGTYNALNAGGLLLGLPAYNALPFLVVGILGANVSTATVRIEFQANFQGQYRNQSVRLGEGDSAVPPATIGWFERLMNGVKMIPHVLPAAAVLADSYADPTGRGLRAALRRYRRLTDTSDMAE